MAKIAALKTNIDEASATITYVGKAAVWSEPYSSYTTAGTFGKLLQDAGGGSSPEVIAAAVWDELTTTHTISGTYGEKVKKLLTLSQFLALKD